jgi:hypothetical protein
MSATRDALHKLVHSYHLPAPQGATQSDCEENRGATASLLTEGESRPSGGYFTQGDVSTTPAEVASLNIATASNHANLMQHDDLDLFGTLIEQTRATEDFLTPTTALILHTAEAQSQPTIDLLSLSPSLGVSPNPCIAWPTLVDAAHSTAYDQLSGNSLFSYLPPEHVASAFDPTSLCVAAPVSFEYVSNSCLL